MLSRLRFTNFKSWPEADMACGPITGIFGTNSSGKSSLIQFLLMLKQTKDATDRAISLELNGDLVQLGTVRDAIHRHDEALTISWSLELVLDSELALIDPSEKKTTSVARGHRLTLEADIAVSQSAPVARRLAYRLGDMRFDHDGEHADLRRPLIDAGVDPSDRKFAALAKRGRAPVANVTDSDRLDHTAVSIADEIGVLRVCGYDRTGWFNPQLAGLRSQSWLWHRDLGPSSWPTPPSARKPDRRAGAHDVAVIMGVLDSSHPSPEGVGGADGARKERPLPAAGTGTCIPLRIVQSVAVPGVCWPARPPRRRSTIGSWRSTRRPTMVSSC